MLAKSASVLAMTVMMKLVITMTMLVMWRTVGEDVSDCGSTHASDDDSGSDVGDDSDGASHVDSYSSGDVGNADHNTGITTMLVTMTTAGMWRVIMMTMTTSMTAQIRMLTPMTKMTLGTQIVTMVGTMTVNTCGQFLFCHELPYHSATL